MPAGDPGSAVRMRAAEFRRVVGGTVGDFAVAEALVASGGVARRRLARRRAGAAAARPETGSSETPGRPAPETGGRAAGGRWTMATYVMLTRLAPESVKTPADLRKLERAVSERVRAECPKVRWLASYAILGPADYLDLFEAPDEETAARVAMIVRSFGHAQTETWTAVPWERFEKLVGA